MKIIKSQLIVTGNDIAFNTFLQLAVDSFFNELEGYINHNTDPVVLDYGHELTLTSMLLNGLTRQNGNRYTITALQEYGTYKKSNSSNGRVDAFVRYENNGIWIEAKYDREGALIKDRLSHWDIEKWLWWDKIEILKQVNDYYLEEGPKVNNSYASHYIMTLAFKKVSEEPFSFIDEAMKELGSNSQKAYDRHWYYSVGYFENEHTGIEVYGTFIKKL